MNKYDKIIVNGPVSVHHDLSLLKVLNYVPLQPYRLLWYITRPFVMTNRDVHLQDRQQLIMYTGIAHCNCTEWLWNPFHVRHRTHKCDCDIAVAQYDINTTHFSNRSRIHKNRTVWTSLQITILLRQCFLALNLFSAVKKKTRFIVDSDIFRRNPCSKYLSTFNNWC